MQLVSLFSAISVSLIAALPLSAQRWEQLGSRRVSFTADRDVIEVGASEGLFNAIRFDVESGNLEMFNVRVVFADGSDFSPDTRLRFREDQRSRVIDLPGTNRLIRRVSFSYSSTMRRGRARVVLFGRHAADGDAPVAGRPPAAPLLVGWEYLGSRTVAFRLDRDFIDAMHEGRFRRLRFTVGDGDLVMYDIKVTFADGSDYSPTTRFEFGERSRSRDFDLPGGARVIRRIEFRYRSVLGGADGRATVHVYAR